MGASCLSGSFTGTGELLGSLVLAPRLTTLFGALVCLRVVGHIVALNFCYDVPVKLFSLHLFVMAAWLALPDLPRLVRFFLLNRPTEPAEIRPLVPWRRVDLGLAGLRTLLVLGFVWMNIAGA